MHDKFEEDTWKTFQVIAPTRSNYRRKMRKIAEISHFDFFSAIIDKSENWSLVTCITNLGRIDEKLYKLSHPQVNVTADDAELQLQ